MKSTKEIKPNGKANDLQKKVSEAIANSLNAISKFKSSKNQVCWSICDELLFNIYINSSEWAVSYSEIVTGSTNLSTTITSVGTSNWPSVFPPSSGCLTTGTSFSIQGRNFPQQSRRRAQRSQKLFRGVQPTPKQTQPQPSLLVIRNGSRGLGQTAARIWLKYPFVYSDGGNLALKWFTTNTYNHSHPYRSLSLIYSYHVRLRPIKTKTGV